MHYIRCQADILLDNGHNLVGIFCVRPKPGRRMNRQALMAAVTVMAKERSGAKVKQFLSFVVLEDDS